MTTIQFGMNTEIMEVVIQMFQFGTIIQNLEVNMKIIPWNSYASNPPKLYNRDGDFFGCFTINTYQPERAEFELAFYIYKNHNEIREDVGRWYLKFLNK